MLEELKDVLGNLYGTYGLTYDILRLSMIVDELIIKEVGTCN